MDREINKEHYIIWYSQLFRSYIILKSINYNIIQYKKYRLYSKKYYFATILRNGVMIFYSFASSVKQQI